MVAADSIKLSLWAYLRPHRGHLAVGVLFLLLTVALEKAIPWLLQHGIDGLRAGQIDLVKESALGVMAIAAVIWGVRTLSRIFIFNVGRDVEFELRNELLANLHRLGPSFLEKMPVGEVLSRATNDLGQVRLLLGFGTMNVVNSVLSYAGALTLMIAISPRLTFYALLPYPLIVLVVRLFGKAFFGRSRAAQEALGRLAERAQEHVSAVRLVRSFAIEGHEQQRFEERNQEALHRNMRLVVLRGFMWPALMGISSLSALVVLWLGGGMVLVEELTVGEFVAFHAYLAQMVWPTLAFGYLLSVVQRGRVAFARVGDILTARPTIEEPRQPAHASGEGALSVRRLTYPDNPSEPVLRDVSFQVPAGGSLAIVGRTGSGKSTLAEAVARMVATPPGSVFLDETDIASVPVRELRSHVLMAQQEPFLFSDTVAHNIGFSLEDPDSPAGQSSIRDAARQACVFEDIVALPDGFATMVGERGVQLSGGQKQRVALARAMLASPGVIILDDPLSAVDAQTEASILQALDAAGSRRTLILITHRVAAAQHCERILVLEEGRIVQEGTHQQLSDCAGPYATMLQTQRLEAELERTDSAE